MPLMKRSQLRAKRLSQETLPKGGVFLCLLSARCLLSGHEILRDMQPPHFPQPRLTPHLRPGFLIEWSEDETGTRHVGIILAVHFHGIPEPLDHYVTVLSPWGNTVFVRQITEVLAVVHHALFLLRSRS